MTQTYDSHETQETNGTEETNETQETNGLNASIESNETEESGKGPEGGLTPLDFWTTAGANGIVLDKTQVDALQRYHDELLYWNAKVNLISRKDENQIWSKHILHSLTLLKYVTFPKKARVLDLGTGGGLPGIPLKIARPDLRVTLCDSVRKKMTMTAMFADHTGMKNIEAVTSRVEDMGENPHYQAAFDVIVSRAVADTMLLMEWVRPLVAPGGFCAFLKGGDLKIELSNARKTYPGVDIREIQIDLFGAPWFKTDEKKIVVVGP
ncbi:MAG: 16S rRNA (guanine(527)-N(7))-methyltransferase RsmG [bacterium]|nr:16S rRNA (guanine(527)-N(7))-methyltransferase RsmG [bacterium]